MAGQLPDVNFGGGFDLQSAFNASQFGSGAVSPQITGLQTQVQPAVAAAPQGISDVITKFGAAEPFNFQNVLGAIADGITTFGSTQLGGGLATPFADRKAKNVKLQQALAIQQLKNSKESDIVKVVKALKGEGVGVLGGASETGVKIPANIGANIRSSLDNGTHTQAELTTAMRDRGMTEAQIDAAYAAAGGR